VPGASAPDKVIASAPANPVAASPLRRQLARWLTEIALPVGAMLGCLALWEVACRVFGIPGYLVPAPSAIWRETLQVAGPVVGHTLATTETVLLGFIASLVVSLPLAVMITASPLIANAVYPLLVVTQSIPKVALAPILVVIFGSNELPRVVVTFLVAFFPLVLSIAAGITAVPPELIELGRACKASRWRELWRIRLPYAVPFVFSGLKAAITLSVVGAVVGEFVNADRGLGYLIVTSTAFFKVPLAWGALLLLSALGIVLFQAVVIVERVFFPWSVSTDKPGL
jgi:NitT/TauT family transport system permease protein